MQRKMDSGGILDFLSPCSITCAIQKSAKGGRSLEGDTTSTCRQDEVLRGTTDEVILQALKLVV